MDELLARVRDKTSVYVFRKWMNAELVSYELVPRHDFLNLIRSIHGEEAIVAWDRDVDPSYLENVQVLTICHYVSPVVWSEKKPHVDLVLFATYSNRMDKGYDRVEKKWVSPW